MEVLACGTDLGTSSTVLMPAIFSCLALKRGGALPRNGKYHRSRCFVTRVLSGNFAESLGGIDV